LTENSFQEANNIYSIRTSWWTIILACFKWFSCNLH